MSTQTDPQPEALPAATAKGSVTLIWFCALAAGVLIAIFSPRAQDGEWLSIAFGLCMVGSLCVQLATKEKRGFVRRLAASVTGAAVILGIATGVAALLHG